MAIGSKEISQSRKTSPFQYLSHWSTGATVWAGAAVCALSLSYIAKRDQGARLLQSSLELPSVPRGKAPTDGTETIHLELYCPLTSPFPSVIDVLVYEARSMVEATQMSTGTPVLASGPVAISPTTMPLRLGPTHTPVSVRVAALSAPSSHYAVRVSAPGFAPVLVWPVNPKSQAAIRLRRGGSIEGVLTVRDQNEDAELPSIMISGESNSGFRLMLKTVRSSHFSCQNVAPGVYRLATSDTGFDLISPDEITVVDERATQVEIVLGARKATE